jgi:uncharacterized membrane protein
MKEPHLIATPSATKVPGIVLGVGIGGFIDGIVLHQLLEWHHMLSSWYPISGERNMRINMVGDGLFHLLCLLVVLAGVALLTKVRPRLVHGDGRRLAGWMLAGWGVFNLVEGVLDHLILGVHHVRPGAGELGYDLGFLVLGGALVGIGTIIGRRSAR